MPQQSIISINGQFGIHPPRQLLAAKAAYYTATNPTVGTAIAYALKTAWSATANGLFTISNNNIAVSGANIYLDKLKLVQTATAPTGTLIMRFEVYNETGIVAMTAAAAAVTPVQYNQGQGTTQTTGAVVTAFNAGAGTIPAAVGTRRLQDIGTISTGVAVTQDVYVLNFGAYNEVDSGPLGAARATDPATITGSIGPCMIAPQTTAIINMWWVTAAANVPSFEFSLGYWEI